MLKIRKSTIIVSSVALAFLGAIPAVAQLSEFDLGVDQGRLGKVWTDFQEYANGFEYYIRNNINDSLNSDVATQTEIAISTDSSLNDLRIPDPNAAARDARDQIVTYSISDKFENNAAVYGAAVSNEVYRLITRTAADGVLNRNGQMRLKGKLEATEEAVEDIVQDVQKAVQENQMKRQQVLTTGMGSMNPQGPQMAAIFDGLSQLLTQSIRIQREQTKMMGESLGNTIQLRNDVQYTNLNLANLSQQMDEVNRARRVDTSAEVARLLRVSAQADLYRKSANPTSLPELPTATPSDPSLLDSENPSLEESEIPSLEESENPSSAETGVPFPSLEQ